MNKKIKITALLLLLAMITVFSARFFLPDPLFDDPCSTVIYDRNGRLLGGQVAVDGQWRFPQPDSIPEKLA